MRSSDILRALKLRGLLRPNPEVREYANAAFNIGRLGAEVVRASGGGSLSVLPSGYIGGPYAGKELASCAS